MLTQEDYCIICGETIVGGELYCAYCEADIDPRTSEEIFDEVEKSMRKVIGHANATNH